LLSYKRGVMNILIIDDEPSFRQYLASILTDVFKHAVTETGSFNEASQLEAGVLMSTDLAFIDLKMPMIDGFQSGQRLKHQYPHLVTVMLTAYPSVDKVIKALRDHQFDDFLMKEALEDVQEFTQLKNALHRAENLVAARKALSDEYQLSDALRTQYTTVHAGFVGHSESFRQINELIDKVAPSDTTVLLTGETGTGKDLVAREIHNRSRRSLKPFVPINCSAIPPGLLESELFGHKKGAFTGAVGDRPGYFKLAAGGTLFLDEIGDMPLELQAKLLRVLEEKQFFPVGSGKLSDSEKLEVRLISATNQDLKQKTESGQFRRDLFYRLNTLVLTIPPLRDRVEDIEPLINYFIAQKSDPDRIKSIQPEALAVLREWSWPGNVRELQNLTERALLFSEGEVLQVEDFPMEIRDLAASAKLAGATTSSLPPGVVIPALESADTMTYQLGTSPGTYEKFWETFKANNFKMWTFENAESVSLKLRTILKDARYVKKGHSGKLLINREKSIDIPITYADVASGDLARFQIRFVFQSKGSSAAEKGRKRAKKTEPADSVIIQPVLKGLPDTYIFNLLYPPIRKSDLSSAAPQRVVRATLLRYILENAPTSTLKSVFDRTLSFLIDSEITGLVEGLSVSGLEAVRAYLCGADHIFSGVARKLKNTPEVIEQEIRTVFPNF
jgi:DNA-binding NtrC family response regulator